MTGRKLLFTGVRQVQTLPLELPPPAPDQLLVAVSHSAISPGTEMLVYRGELPTDLSLDANIAALSGGPQYPLAYGYAAVGQVMARGAALSDVCECGAFAGGFLSGGGGGAAVGGGWYGRGCAAGEFGAESAVGVWRGGCVGGGDGWV